MEISALMFFQFGDKFIYHLEIIAVFPAIEVHLRRPLREPRSEMQVTYQNGKALIGMVAAAQQT